MHIERFFPKQRNNIKHNVLYVCIRGFTNVGVQNVVGYLIIKHLHS